MACEGCEGWAGSFDGWAGASACCCSGSRLGSADGAGLAACDSAGGPVLAGSGRPTFDGELSKLTMIGSSCDSVGCRGESHQIAPAIRACSSTASATAAGGMCSTRGWTMRASVTVAPFQPQSVSLEIERQDEGVLCPRDVVRQRHI